MSTPSAASTESVAITAIVIISVTRNSGSSVAVATKAIRRLYLLRRADDRSPSGDLPQHVREQQHEADAESELATGRPDFAAPSRRH